MMQMSHRHGRMAISQYIYRGRLLIWAAANSEGGAGTRGGQGHVRSPQKRPVSSAIATSPLDIRGCMSSLQQRHTLALPPCLDSM
jgi:hypothetical protein